MKEAREREMLQHYQLYYLNVFIVKHTMYYNTIKIYKERAINSQASKLKKKKKKLSDLSFSFLFTHLSFFSSLKYDDELSSFICEVVFSKHVLFSFLQSSQYQPILKVSIDLYPEESVFTSEAVNFVIWDSENGLVFFIKYLLALP